VATKPATKKGNAREVSCWAVKEEGRQEGVEQSNKKTKAEERAEKKTWKKKKATSRQWSYSNYR